MPSQSIFNYHADNCTGPIDQIMGAIEECNELDAVIENGILKSTVMELEIPDVDFATFFRAACERNSEDTALTDGATGQSYTYAHLLDLWERAAGGFQKLGLEAGDTVAFAAVNSIDLVVAMVGAMFAGAKIACVKATLKQKEIERVLNMTKPKMLFCDMYCAEKAVQASKESHNVQTLVVAGDYDGMVKFSTLKESPRSKFKRPSGIDPNDVLMIAQTSGSTGLPKAGLITHRNFIAAVVTLSYNNKSFRKDDVLLVYLPLLHYAPNYIFFVMLTQHARVVLLATFDLATVLAQIPKYKVTSVGFYPTHIQQLLRQNLVSSYDVSSVRSMLSGTSSIPEPVMKALARMFPKCDIMHTYGTTETGGAVAYTRGTNWDMQSSGKPAACVEMKVVDIKTGRKLAPGECGEIRVKGPMCFKGYLEMPEETAEIFDEEQFLKTGDLGYYSARGELYVRERIKDLIKCMDNQVVPAEVEEMLRQHPDVLQAAVAGIPHPEYGEAARAFVVLNEGVPLSTEAQVESKKRQLMEYMESIVSAPKQLHGGVEFVAAIPQTDTGKPNRRALREAYLQLKQGEKVCQGTEKFDY